MKELLKKKNSSSLMGIRDCYVNQEMCEKVVERNEYTLKYIPDQYKTKKMYEISVKKGTFVYRHL